MTVKKKRPKMKMSRGSLAASIGGAVGVAIASLLFPAEARLAVIMGAAIGAMLGALILKGIDS